MTARNDLVSRTVELQTWVLRRQRREKRRENMTRLGNALGFLLVQLLAMVQFAVGPLRSMSFSDELVSVLILSQALTILLLFVMPDRMLRICARFMHVTGQRLTDAVVTVLLTLIYLGSLPLALLFGRRAFTRRHRGAVSWVDGSEYRGRSTWTDKQFEADTVNRRNRSTVWRTLRFFTGQRNWFILVVVTLLLLVASFLALASSPVVAPFIYPLI